MSNSFQKLFSFTLFLALLFTSAIQINAANTIVEGRIEDFNGKKIKIGIYTDYLTFEKQWLQAQTIKEGKFHFDLELNTTTHLLIEIEDKQTNLFAESGKTYFIKLSYDAALNQGKAFDKMLDLNFPIPQQNDINLEIRAFNKDYQDFFAENYQRFVIKAATKEINAFVAKWDKNKATIQNEFVKNYISYSLANLEDINNISDTKLYEKYFEQKPILYSNKEYMNFFNQYYKQNFEQLALTKNGAEVLKALMLEKDLARSRRLIMEFKKIKSEPLAELYLLKGLYEVYHKETIDQESNVEILEQIKKNGLNDENKQIAKNILKNLLRFEKEQLAPNFQLANAEDAVVELNDFQGKYIYLNFWADWSIPSLRELKVIKLLNDKYGDKIHFISINLDEDDAIYKSILNKNSYEWTFLHIGDNFELKEKYGVKTVPSYFLIDKNGKMLQAFAPNPAEMEKRLFELSNQ